VVCSASLDFCFSSPDTEGPRREAAGQPEQESKAFASFLFYAQDKKKGVLGID
jgi:hypothetical protein